MTTGRCFRSKVDTWLVWVMFGSVIISATPPLVLIAAGAPPGPLEAVGLLAIPLTLAALHLWLVRTTDYTVERDVLRVRSGPLRITVPLAAITSVAPTRTLLSSPALSLDRLAIHRREGRTVVISPEDQSGFLRALADAGVDVRHPPLM